MNMYRTLFNRTLPSLLVLAIAGGLAAGGSSSAFGQTSGPVPAADPSGGSPIVTPVVTPSIPATVVPPATGTSNFAPPGSLTVPAPTPGAPAAINGATIGGPNDAFASGRPSVSTASVAPVLNEPGANNANVSSIVLPIRGTVDGSPEGVAVTGRIAVQSTIVLDPDFGTPPTLILRISFVNMTGRGMVTGQAFVTGNQSQVIRSVRVADVLEMNFPLFITAAGMLTARPGLASLTLQVNRTSGQILSGTASVSTPVNAPIPVGGNSALNRNF